jgi:hypothetical protein
MCSVLAQVGLNQRGSMFIKTSIFTLFSMPRVVGSRADDALVVSRRRTFSIELYWQGLPLQQSSLQQLRLGGASAFGIVSLTALRARVMHTWSCFQNEYRLCSPILSDLQK